MERAFRPTFSTVFVASALMAGWGWPECGNGSTNSEAGWICIRTAAAPGWSPRCRGWSVKAPPKKLPQIDRGCVGRTLPSKEVSDPHTHDYNFLLRSLD